MNRRQTSVALLALSACALSFLLSCDSREAQATASAGATVTLAPRLVMGDGDSVIPVDSVRVVVTLEGATSPFKSATVRFADHHLAIPGVPVGSRYTIRAMGIKIAADRRHFPVWWEGSQQGTATLDTTPVRWDVVHVSALDTVLPALAGPSLPASDSFVVPNGTTSDTLSFQARSTDTVFVGGIRKAPATTSGDVASYLVPVSVPDSVEVSVVSASGNVRLRVFRFSASSDPATNPAAPTISFVHPATADTVFEAARTSYAVEVLPRSASGVDSVVVSCGGRRTRLLSAPWTVELDLQPGLNPVLDTVFARNGKIASGSASLRNPVVPGDSTPPTIRLLSPTRPADTVDWNVREWSLRWKIWDDRSLRSAWLVGQNPSAVAADSVWTSLQPLGPGPNTFHLIAQDTAGNADSQTVTIFRRSYGGRPSIERGQGASSRLLKAGTVQAGLTWTASDSEGVAEVSVNGATAERASAGASVTLGGTARDRIVTAEIAFASDSVPVVLVVRNASGLEAKDSVCLRVARKPVVVRTTHTGSSDSVPFDSSVVHLSWTVQRTRGLASTTLRLGTDTVVLACLDTACTAVPGLAVGANDFVLVARDSVGDSTSDAFSVFRKTDSLLPTIDWLGKNRDRRDTLAFGAEVWQPEWNVVGRPGLVVDVGGSSVSGSGSAYGISIPVRRDARGWDTTVRISAHAGNGPVAHDSAILRVLPSANVPAATTDSRDVVISYLQSTFDAAWTVRDSTLQSVLIDGVSVTGSGGAFHRQIPCASARDTFWVHLLAADSGGGTFEDSIRVRRLGPIRILSSGSTVRDSLPVALSTNLAGATFQWSTDNAEWNDGATLQLRKGGVLYAQASLGNCSVGDSAIFVRSPVITPTWLGYSNSFAIAISAPGADSIESSNGAGWSRYTTGFTTTRSAIVKARAKFRSLVSDEVSLPVLMPVELSPNSGSGSISIPVQVGIPGSCDSLRTRSPGGAWVVTSRCTTTVSVEKTGTLSAEAWLGGKSVTASGSYTVRHDTSLLGVGLPAGMPTVSIAGTLVALSDSLPFGTKEITLVASVPSGATVTYNGSTSGTVTLVNDTLGVRIEVTSGIESQGYLMFLYAKKSSTFTDPRDGTVYPIVRVGEQTWMAKNLAYAGPNPTTDPIGVCRSDPDSCAAFGRYYRFHEALSISSYYDTFAFSGTGNVQGACPTGWHVGSEVEWADLQSFAEGASTRRALSLMSKSGWSDFNSAPGNGTDEFGFRILPAGFYVGWFDFAGRTADFWTSTQQLEDPQKAINWTFSAGDPDGSGRTANLKSQMWFNVRCAAD